MCLCCRYNEGQLKLLVQNENAKSTGDVPFLSIKVLNSILFLYLYAQEGTTGQAGGLASAIYRRKDKEGKGKGVQKGKRGKVERAKRKRAAGEGRLKGSKKKKKGLSKREFYL